MQVAYFDPHDAVAVVEAQKKKDRQERTAKIVAGTLIAFTVLVGVYFIFFYD